MKVKPIQVGDKVLVYGDIPGVIRDIKPELKCPYQVETARGRNWVALCVITRDVAGAVRSEPVKVKAVPQSGTLF